MIIEQLTKELNLKTKQVENTVKLIDEGNTIPFIARYRKEVTGGLSDVVLRELFERLTYLRNLNERKEEVIRLIDEQGKLTEELKAEITKATVLQRVEDLYRPYKQKKRTRASKAKEKGLEPLANIIHTQEMIDGDIEELAKSYINEELKVLKVTDALNGAKDIIAEIVSDNAEFRKEIRNKCLKDAVIHCEAVDEEEESVYEMYYKYHETVNKIPNHRVLAINRGEKDKKLKVKMEMQQEEILSYIKNEVITNSKAITTYLLEDAIEDGYKRLIAPAIEREIRNILSERAEEEAIKVFSKNTEKLLMTPPVKGAKVMAIDPSYRTGCKITMLDETGKLLDYVTIYPNPPQNHIEKSRKIVKDLLDKYNTDLISIGNGTASRETEQFIADTLKELDKKINYTIVSEAGASVYSASKVANEEYPDIDVSTRGAISIGRRLQDPLAELVKIDPKHIGVGQYQHDLNQSKLNDSLKNVVEDCVNRVGVDLNTASPSLLQYIAGISSSIAKNIVKYREEKGKFSNRSDIIKVPRLGEKAFEQCAGFLRISEAENLLDNTGVHPESYDITLEFMDKLGFSLGDLKEGKLSNLDDYIIDYSDVEEAPVNMNLGKRIKSLKEMAELKKVIQNKNKVIPKSQKINKNIEKIAKELNVGVPTLKDIVEELKKPGRDPRDEMPEVIFRDDVLKIEDLKLDMELTGTVRNVVDFGAFVDIGVKQDGLVHISQMSSKYIKHPMDVVNVGDTVKVKVIDIDLNRQKISLSMKELNN